MKHVNAAAGAQRIYAPSQPVLPGQSLQLCLPHMIMQNAHVLFLFAEFSFHAFSAVQHHHESDAQDQLQYRRHRSCKPYFEQRCIRLYAHQIRYRHTHSECAYDPLYHHEFRPADPVVKTYVTEEYRREHTVYGISSEIFGSRRYYARIR